MTVSNHENRPPQPVAIVGVGAIMPEAPSAAAFWENITGGRYSITDVPKERWDPGLYYDPDPRAPDKTYSRIGGWVREFTWDPFGWHLPLPPKVGDQMDDGQKWSVAAAHAALTDAGWPGWSVDPERVAVIIGNAIGGEKHYATNMRIQLPEFTRELARSATFAGLPAASRQAVIAETTRSYLSQFPEITEDTMPGELANITASRISALFGFRGPSYTTDAACASGLAGLAAACQGLADGEYDAVVTGGVDRNMGVAAFVKFCKIGALSATGTRPFDAGADGFVMGEGAALFVLRRLEDAERDGDRIYASLLGIAGSSDGKGKGITAPNPAGQRLAIAGAWRRAGVDPATVSYVEAHGTSTRVGDAAELESLHAVFGGLSLPAGAVALGSVKSNIGHLKAAAGTAGLLKMVKALNDKVLPPSLHFTEPNPNVDWAASPFAVNTELREWPRPPCGVRRGGVSAFGFGGTNFHVVVEEYVPGLHDGAGAHALAVTGARPGRRGPLRGAVVVGGSTEADVAGQLNRIAGEPGSQPAIRPPDPALAAAPVRVAIDYADAADLAGKAALAAKALAGGAEMRKMLRARGVFIGHGAAPKVAFLYPGQGSQYVNMLGRLRETEPLVAGTFAEADEVMTPLLGRPLSDIVFAADASGAAAAEAELMRTEITQPAVLTADIALTRLLGAYGVVPDLVMGHSLGEYAALVAAGALSFRAALEAVSARGREMASLTVADPGAMAAVMAPLEEIERALAAIDGYVVIANINSLHQAVIGGATAAVERAVSALTQAGYTATRIPVSHAFHTQIVAPASEPLRRTLTRLGLQPPRIPVVANVDGEFYPEVTDQMLGILGRQVASPVQFVKGLRTLYDAGARVFVEVGPKRALHGFTEDVLADAGEDVLALFTNHPKNGDIASFNAALCGLYAAGLGYGAAPAVPEAARRAPEPTDAGAAMSDDRYAELGHLVADLLDRGRRILDGTSHTNSAEASTAPQAGSPAARTAPAAAEPVVITGAALGLPGTERVFDDENVARILAGEQFIDTIPRQVRREMVDKHITRLVKSDTGDPVFETIESEHDVIKLAGRYAAIDVVADFGVDADRDAALDSCTRLAIGAGLDALRDAGIPLVRHYHTTTLGTVLPDRWGLPDEMRDDTGVIFASAFPGYESFADDLNRYHADRARRHELEVLTDLRGRMSADDPAAREADRRIAELRHALQAQPFAFDRRFLFRALAMGHSQFAELIGARGPNTQLNAACASTAQALCVAEDWIAAGRCRRVIVVSADNAASDTLLPWTGSGFLASGAAATDDVVEEAALPFDRRRHGMIIGSGAAALVVESAEAARERGIAPACELVAAVTANSAFHGTRLDVSHIGEVMERLIAQAEGRGIDRNAIAGQTVFVSHETYTPARGGSASAEISALRRVFGPAAGSIVIANTKGFTGHAMGAGIEEVVAVKALETGIVPPVPNYREPDPELGSLNLSRGGAYPIRYALRLAAGFGSQITMTLLRWAAPPDGRHHAPSELGYAYRIADQAAWRSWLARVSGQQDPKLEVVTRRLRVADDGPAAVPSVRPEPAAVPAGPEPAAAPAAAPAPVTVQAPAAVPGPAPAPEPAPAAVAVSASGDASADPVAEAVLDVVESLTGYPRNLLDTDLDLEADLGVDTVKQAEVFAAVRERFAIPRQDNLRLRDFPTLAHVIGFVHDNAPQAPASQAEAAPEAVVPGATAEPAEAAASADTAVPAGSGDLTAEPGADAVADTVLRTVERLTGYPRNLLDADLDLEADLGIDTVKQAEVFAAVRQAFGIARDENLRLRDFPTLGHVIRFASERSGQPDRAGPAPRAAEPPAAVRAAAPESPAAEPPAVAEPLAVAETAAPERPGDDQIADAVLGTVERLTGYPRNLLDADLDLEADLGIDTVKQAEVFAAVRQAFGIARDENLRLRDFPTLGHVIAFARERAAAMSGSAAAGSAPDQADQAPAEEQVRTAPAALPGLAPAFTADMARAERLPRRLPVPVLRPPAAWCKPTGVVLDGASRVIIMADEGGVGQALARRLTSLGAAALVLEAGADDLAGRVDGWLADGPVQGVYWLAALDAEAPLGEIGPAGWREALRLRVKNLYAVVRRLDAAGQLGGAGTFLVAATRLGGYHGYDEAGALAPLGGAVTGFVKAYGRERPDILAKAVDFPASRKTAALADALIEETGRDAGAVEIGRADGRRWSVGLRVVPFGDGSGGMTLGPDTVFAVTGAAGAIVSAIVADLASASGGTFHLLDLAPEPDPGDADLIGYATDRDGFKKVIAERLAAAGTRPTPVLIERELARCERLHSALIAIEAVRAAGGEACYHQLDLTDPAAVAAVMDGIRDRHRRVDVLLHAAGLDISHAIGDKEPREYDLVFDVKSDGLFNLLHAAGDMPVGAVVAFSSVAGRFGNMGQTDYSAANDLLCKVMSSFRATRPCTRGIAIDWTAWGGLGMATRGSIPKVMAMAGIEMLEPEAGIGWVRRELTAGPFGGEVIVGGALGLLTAEPDPAGGLDLDAVDAAASGPMIGAVTGMGVFSGLTAQTTLDPATQPFLNDHRIDSVAVLPGVMGIEAFAALAGLAVPDLQVAGVEQMDFLAPVKFYRDEPRTLTIRAQVMPASGGLVADCALTASRTLKGEQVPRVTTHFTGRIRLASAPEPGERAEAPAGPAGPAAGHDDIYRVFFHGPAYQVIDEAWHRGDAAVARVAAHLPADHQPQDGRTATEPRLAEACFQAAGLWEIGRTGHMALPAHADRVTIARRPGRDAQLFAIVEPVPGGYDCRVADGEGNVVLRVDGYRTAGVDGSLPPGLIQPIHDAMSG